MFHNDIMYAVMRERARELREEARGARRARRRRTELEEQTSYRRPVRRYRPA
ncbi:hypothetical protein GCM10009678_12000 [Actinomadura kijaniata]|uniref:Uncharacterized protein n=1 Tax=Actinomadura namibiensis TaxID=182080 RepID=A0A7W3QLE0_ACTNM|nr:hypothetical protein [Actinomadura namibiensis]MBA8951326.1 hypothetical protein [Actinomadura namibiensis]